MHLLRERRTRLPHELSPACGETRLLRGRTHGLDPRRSRSARPRSRRQVGNGARRHAHHRVSAAGPGSAGKAELAACATLDRPHCQSSPCRSILLQEGDNSTARSGVRGADAVELDPRKVAAFYSGLATANRVVAATSSLPVAVTLICHQETTAVHQQFSPTASCHPKKPPHA